jgi:hypothetical protein
MTLNAPNVEWRNQRVDSKLIGPVLTVLLPDDGKGFDVRIAETAK